MCSTDTRWKNSTVKKLSSVHNNLWTPRQPDPIVVACSCSTCRMGLVVRHSSPFMSPLVREFNLSCAKYTRPDSGNPHGLDSGPSPDVVQHFAGQSQYWRRLSHHPPACVP